MAEVYLARDQLLDRPVAVKVLFPEFAADRSFVERFRREAQAAANLNHPNIVCVYDWGEEDGTYFIVMEYVEGRSLAEIIRTEGPLHPDRAADIAPTSPPRSGSPTATASCTATSSPATCSITATGQVKVADFGIARAIEPPRRTSPRPARSWARPRTSRPSRPRAAAVDPRSDLYSLGVRALRDGGRPPAVPGDTPVAIAYKHVHETPDTASPRPDVPEALEAIMLKRLAKNPANRYPTADELRADLRRFREGKQCWPNRCWCHPSPTPRS